MKKMDKIDFSQIEILMTDYLGEDDINVMMGHFTISEENSKYIGNNNLIELTINLIRDKQNKLYLLALNNKEFKKDNVLIDENISYDEYSRINLADVNINSLLINRGKIFASSTLQDKNYYTTQVKCFAYQINNNGLDSKNKSLLFLGLIKKEDAEFIHFPNNELIYNKINNDNELNSEPQKVYLERGNHISSMFEKNNVFGFSKKLSIISQNIKSYDDINLLIKNLVVSENDSLKKDNIQKIMYENMQYNDESYIDFIKNYYVNGEDFNINFSLENDIFRKDKAYRNFIETMCKKSENENKSKSKSPLKPK